MKTIQLNDDEQTILCEALGTAMAAVWKLKEEAWDYGANNVGKMLYDRYVAFSDLQEKIMSK